MEYLIFQIIFFSFLLIRIYKKNGNNILMYICTIWIVSSVFSALFCTYYNPQHIEIQSVVFFDVCFMLCLFSLSKFKYENVQIKNYEINNFYHFMLLFGLVSTFPLFENTIYVVQSYFSNNTNDVIDMYNAKMDVDVDARTLVTWLSLPSKIINSFSCRLLQLSYVLFFLLLSHKKIKTRNLIICAFPILNPLMYGIAKSGRGAVVFAVLYLIFLYILFGKQLEERLKKKLKIGFLTIFGFFMCITLLLTFLRFSDSASDRTMLISTSLYLGEGQVRFFDEMWNIRNYTAGDNSFSFFKYVIGENTFVNYLERREYWDIAKTGVDPRFFYTFIGDIYSDIGKYSLLLYGLLFVAIRKCLQKEISICVFYMLCVFCYILITGFTTYQFKIFDLTLNVFTGLFVLFVLSKINSNKISIRQ